MYSSDIFLRSTLQNFIQGRLLNQGKKEVKKTKQRKEKQKERRDRRKRGREEKYG